MEGEHDMKLTTGPDLRYTAVLSNGKAIRGSRNKILNDALLAATKGITVVKWRAPGATEQTKQGRIDRLDEEYKAGLRSL